MRLSELGEFGLLAELERRGLAREIGDDAAHLSHGLVVTQDLLAEQVHFRREWTSWRDLGYKAAAVNLSDLAAMGARPVALLVALALPPDAEAEAVLELYEGLNEPVVPVVGGDLSAADRVWISVTAIGRTERAPGRGGAVPGDVLVVTGALGGSAAGLHVLRNGLAGFGDLVARHRRPPYRLGAGELLAPSAHALTDLSDGILSDAARIAERSRCRLVVDVDRLPLARGLERLADEPFWARGEDYELLAALDASDPLVTRFHPVGHCEEGAGVEVRRDGRPVQVTSWEHFRV
ncbi:MAG: thiamine-phosphate kinase [Thermoleophilia bacterium]|nr:thiamine-phosphate kinase [Thermoleophilia bacterium]